MCHASSVRVADKGTVPGGDRHSDGEKGGEVNEVQSGHGSLGRLRFH